MVFSLVSQMELETFFTKIELYLFVLYNFLKIANVLNLDLGKFLGDYKF